MTNVIYAIVAIIVMLLVLIGWHEFGHFYIARRLGIKVLRFAIGFGKPIWRHRARDNTEYVVCLLPLGGYVKLLDEREAPVTAADLPYAFNRQPVYKRALVIIAGAVFNLIFAIPAY